MMEEELPPEDQPGEEQEADEGDNVVRIWPDMRTPDEEREKGKQDTLGLLEIITERVKAGEFCDIVVVCGLNEGRQDISGVATFFSNGALENLPMFLGGLELAKSQMIATDKDMFYEDDE